MSFGFGIGDFLAVIQLARETRKAFVEAPVQFKSISDEVRNLSLVLQDVEIDISAKELSSQQQADLCELSAGCHEVLVDISKKIEDYTELSTINDGKRNIAKRAWKRLKWEPSDIQELRLRIGTNIALLTAFNGQVMKRSVAKLVQHQDEEARQKVLDWLSPSNYATQQSDYISRREQGTGQWFLDSAEFKSWMSGSKEVLFCPGIPGAGKTILASIVIDELHDRFGSGGEVAIAYLYCNFKRQDEQSATALLSSLLKQLAQSQSPLPTSIQEMYKAHTDKGTRPSMGDVTQTIIQLLSKTSDLAKVYIVIDALDECRMYDRSRTRLLDAMFKLQDACNINLLATSRFIPEITESFNEQPALEIRASTADVMRYLRGNLAMLPAFVSRNPELQIEISTEISTAVDGMFLLAQLYLNSLVGKRSPKAVRSALKDILSSTKQYDAAYHDAMKRIQGQVSDQTEMAMQVLAWITCAKRPLTTVELQSALAVEMNESDLDEDNIPDLIDMVSVCAGLVTIDEQSNVIRLVHYTTQDFFQRNQSTWFPNAHYDIGSICVAYLSFDSFQIGHCQTVEDFILRRDHYPFGPYAAAFWGSHIRDCEANGEQPINKEAIIALLLDGPKLNSCVQFMLSTYSGIHDPEFSSVNMEFGGCDYPLCTSQIATGLHIATYFGLLDVIQMLISLGASVDSVDAVERTPLLWAAQHNIPDAIASLLENGADPNIKDEMEMSPLFLASSRGHERAVQLLLEANGDLLSMDLKERLPLHASVLCGSENVTRLLLEQGINAHPKDGYGYTPLHNAIRLGHLNLVQLLFDWDLDLDRQNLDLNVLIALAAYCGHEAIVQFLLDRGADPNGWDSSDRTPLMSASMSGELSVLQLLLKCGVELEIRERNGHTALSLAAAYSKTHEVIQLLLEAGADINIEDSDGKSVFFHAARSNRHNNLDVLFTSTNIKNIHQPDRVGRTPLHVASMHGHLQSVITLLKTHGVDCEAKDQLGCTALSLAAAYSKTHEVIQLLLEAGADINTEDNHGQSVFFHAASEDRYANLTALSSSKNIRNIHQPNRYGQTPLHVAAARGNLQSLLTLLKIDGIELEVKDSVGQTALSHAAGCRNTEVFQLLLENGADINTEDNYGRGVFFHAASANRYTTLTALIASTKIRNIHQPDRYGRTPLHVAATGGHLQSVLTLLKGYGVNCETQDNFGRTALSEALLRERFDVVEVLKPPSETYSLVTFHPVDEATQFHMQLPCAICMVNLFWRSCYHCAACDRGSFIMCEVCYDIGARCLDRSHELLLVHNKWR